MRSVRRITLVLPLLGWLAAGMVIGQSTSYAKEIEQWRVEHEKQLKSETGWLTLAGLFWLKIGSNSIGRGDGYDVRLTENFSGQTFGNIEFDGKNAVLRVLEGVAATVGGRPVTTQDLVPDDAGKATVVQTGTQSFYVIKREGRYAVRLKDREARTLRFFAGLHWYEIDERFRVTAEFEPFSEPKDVLVPNVLGGSFKMKSPGVLRFRIGSRTFTLEPVVEDGEKQLFIIFRDLSSKKASYGAGRFLYSELPRDGKVILDFNEAENPPCAYTPFATCPLPPAQNRLDVEIPAGERKYDH